MSPREQATSEPFRLAPGRPHRARAHAVASPSTGDAMRGARAIRSPRRCSPTACISSGVHSSIIVRAASSAPAPRNRTRWWSWARREAPSPTARNRPSSFITGWRRASQNRWPSLALRCPLGQLTAEPVPSARVLLQDIHVAGGLLGGALRAADQARRRAWAARRSTPTPIATRRPTPIATCWSSAPARRGSWRRSPPGAPARASSWRRRIFALAGVCLSERASLDGAPASAWAESALAELAGLDTVRLMRRTTVFGVYDQGTYGAVERVNDHVAMPPAHEPRQRGWRIVAKRSGARLRRYRACARLCR